MKINCETNIFPILNLNELTAQYCLFEIKGLIDKDDDYDTNIQYIIRSLSYSLKHPVTVIHQNKVPFLVIKDDPATLNKLPEEYYVKKGDCIYFERTGDSFIIDFKKYDDKTKIIILRFLQFDLYTEISKNKKLWLPGSGEAFFSKESFDSTDEVSIYKGFIPRVIELPTGGFGICVDITKKYVSKNPLSVNMTKEEFNTLKLSKCHLVYRYGDQWYEIRPDELSSLNVKETKFKRTSDGKLVTLLEDIQQKFSDFMPPEVAKLPDTASVIIYKTSTMEDRKAPAALCYRVYDTEDPAIGKVHEKSRIKPFYRRKLIKIVQRNYLSKINYGNKNLKIAESPMVIETGLFQPPDLLFRNNNVLSVRGTENAHNVSIEGLGQKKKELLTSSDIGFFTNAPYERQYIVLPETIYNTYGGEKYFLNDLKYWVDRMHRTEKRYTYNIITYDDRNKKESVDIAFEILEKISEKVDTNIGGYAVVMLPSHLEKQKRKHDEVAAAVVTECLYEFNLNVGIMHTATLQECYRHKLVNGNSVYYVDDKLRSKYSGYVKGVAINQVLLNNERWPFILKTPLHADLTIGIDVKQHIAGFTFIDKYSKNIKANFDKSSNKERLSTDQVYRVLIENVSLQCEHAEYPIKNIVIHRDGRIYKTEIKGINNAIFYLKEKGIITNDASLNIVEIPKNSIIPFRLFEILGKYDIFNDKNDNGKVLNPKIGSWKILGNNEAFLCNTGREYDHGGTTKPQYIKYCIGIMPFVSLLEDIYYLANLTYTKPDDCSRFPLTVKITDRRINLLGSDYNSEKIELLKSANIKTTYE